MDRLQSETIYAAFFRPVCVLRACTVSRRTSLLKLLRFPRQLPTSMDTRLKRRLCV